MLRCFFGDSIAERESALLAELSVSEDIRAQHIIILPTNRWKRRFVEKLSATSRRAISPDFIFSYNEFLSEIYAFLSITQAEQFSKQAITPYIQEYFMARTIEKSSGSFVYYAELNSNAPPRGTIRRFLRLIDELTQAGHSATSFVAAIGDAPKLADIARVFQSYETDVLSTFYTQNTLPYEFIKFYTREHFAAQFGKIKKLSFLYFDAYSHSMCRIIERLSAFAQSVELHVFGDIHSETLVHTKSDLSYLIKNGMELVSGRKNEAFRQVPAKAAQFESFEDELEAILAEIYRQNRDCGVALEDIVLTYPEIDSIAEQLRWRFEEAEIPFNMSSDLPLAEVPIIQFLLTIFRLKTANFYHLDVIRFFQSPFIDKAKFHLPTFQSAVAATRSEHSQQKVLAWLEENKGEETATALRELEEHISALFKHGRHADSLEREFFQFLRKYAVLEKLGELNDEANSRAFLRFKELFDQYSAVWLRYLNDYSQVQFIEDFTQELREARYQLREIRGVGVQIVPMLEARSEEPACMFVAGLNQSGFPKSSPIPIILNSFEREELQLDSADFTVEKDRYVLGLLLSKSCQHFLSDSSKNSELDAPSFLFSEWLEENDSAPWAPPAFRIGKRQERANLSGNVDLNWYNVQGAKRSFAKPPVYSASRIEDFISCEYRYFVLHHLRLRAFARLETEESKADLGSLLHKVMFRLYSQEKQIRTFPRAKRLEIIQAVLSELVHEEEKHIRELKITQEQIEEILRVDADIAGEYEPAFLEWRFGYSAAGDEDAASTDAIFELSDGERSAAFQGQIDRVDLNEEGSAIVVDYKNSARVKSGDIASGESIQLVLYALAAVDLLQGVHEVDSGYIFAIGAQKNVSKNMVLGDFSSTKKRTKYKDSEGNELSYDEFLQQSKARILTLVEHIENGDFTLAPKDTTPSLKTCAYCDVKTACRIRERQRFFENDESDGD